MPKIIPVVICTGHGAGLWPIARETMPKQFIPLFGRDSTFQRTLRLLSDPGVFDTPIVVTNAEQRFTVADQLQAIGLRAEIVLEPAGRGAHSAAAIAAELGLARSESALVGIFPADHVVQDGKLFVETCARAAAVAAQGRIVAIGIPPCYPATAYGYIRPGTEIAEGVRGVEDVAAKPDAALAARYLADGYLWNSGNVVFDAATMQVRLQAATRAPIGNGKANGVNLGIRMLEADGSADLPAIAAEPQVLEQADTAAVIAGHFGWSDVGNWSAVWQLSEKGAHGNVVQGRGYVLDGANNLVRSEDAVVAIAGLDDVAVIATRDAILVTSKAKADKVKDVVALVAANHEPEAASHREIHRPWGKYLSVDLDERHQVKRITVKPNGVLSLQKHHHRAEHWVVVRGTAQVTRDHETILVHENEAIYLPIGCVHRMANPGKIPLEIIEVQVGSYLGEDDIIRIEDIYQRC
ncbi:Mannose-6-phosphate isomerase / Mannose-1-phosphate guanylyltransferase [Bosea sp. 62]|uniref:mannose-1-phosphate guanylyltransferase/mannose-6-phosphate isomerase n=1 Tax=unclassified Bosea (in: a-proteobacteria) TaxID=2653178 RepID=UPI001256D24B|nr:MULTISPECIES: mannose-1-phosphate guanylyltransferase/mannose-6-phosphate isomerase [unclassified Bosea (in: a-proteobacteria)]CAD5256996.1 Mannose-6-phosphate isomerase / Mannose-1-phosphate guanylyltransferase [Bosea sp. 46]CAD5261441.1 Mannose-6-phosphate isomerase / Mannose-1-phosphate guanylyltransferase [Bosea sp. 21B]CAD5279164.1 Mannose-6-phosphate isomerase / Mannose-1-phosphate guanylyltransferase [Bosea sp. 7B]VVT58475.1 Mannose-6-phosphate isomerase / Mannose-1-phosphate guanylyl